MSGYHKYAGIRTSGDPYPVIANGQLISFRILDALVDNEADPLPGWPVAVANS